MKKIYRLIAVVLLLMSMTACVVSPSPIGEATPGNTPVPSPGFTLSPVRTPSPTESPEPTQGPSTLPSDKSNTIYTLDKGDGKYPYAWTAECPVSGEIKYGTQNSSEVKAVQQRLTQLGFYCGSATGTFNNLTLTALNEFQAAVGLDKTSDLTWETINVLYSPDGIEAMSITDYDIPNGVLDGMTVFVDAGHGGLATGTARGSVVEKTVVLELSYRLKALLEKAGARVIMTRSDESDKSLTYRSALTNYVILSDMLSQTESEINTLEEMIETVRAFNAMSAEEINEKAQSLLREIYTMLAPLNDAKENVEAALAQYGKLSQEYADALKLKNDMDESAKSLREDYNMLMQIYYSQQMGVGTSAYEARYQNEIDELSAYRDKLAYYIDLLIVNLNEPAVEFGGLWEKSYDQDGYKIIAPELAEIFDLTGTACADNYIFISVHVNGVDNADYVSGTEIYTRNNNSSNNVYGINRYYYSNYNVTARNEFAACVKNAIDSVVPLQNGKSSVVKESDLFVLREINIPCILLETAYVTNEYDRIALQKPQTREAFAYALYLSVCNYYLS